MVREQPLPFEPATEAEYAEAGQGRELRLGNAPRLLIILAWFVGAPTVLALLVIGYLGLTLIERALTAP